VEALQYLLLFVTKHLSSRLIHLHLSSVLQMPQHTETMFSYDIDTISKQVIQPISCNWSGCAAATALQSKVRTECRDIIQKGLGTSLY
jgi:hypothetical protein